MKIPDTPSNDLRRIAMRGGMLLALRQIVGAAISLVGIVLLVDLIGAREYGAFSAARSVFVFLYSCGPVGINVYLIRSESPPRREDYDQAITLLLLIGAALVIVSMPAVIWLGPWIGSPDASWLALMLVCLVPGSLCSLVPVAQLERALAYRFLASIELGGLSVLHLVSVGGALLGFGAIAPTAGLCLQVIAVASAAFLRTGYRPRLRFEWARIRALGSYGLSYAISLWLLQSCSLVNPLVVGRYAGAEAVGIIALCLRILDNLSFVKTVAARVSLAVIGKVQTERHRVARSIEDGTALQLLALSPILLGFSLTGQWILPILFHRDWQALLSIFPFLAVEYIFATLTGLQSATLYVLCRNKEMIAFNAIRLFLLAAGAIVLVPRFQAVGYGMAECLSIVSYLAIYVSTLRSVGPVAFEVSLAIAAAFSLALFWPIAGPAAVLGFIPLLGWPRLRMIVWKQGKAIWDTRSG